MKKSLIVLAVLGTVAGAASAQSAITVYGLIDAGIVPERGGPNGSVTKLTSGVQNGSRIGFKGNEDLGGGIAAKFLIESGFNVDTGTMGQASATAPNGLLFGRQAYVGLGSNAWGNVLLGRQYTPHYTALTQIDPFGAGLAGNIVNLFPAILRTNNTIKYTAPEGGWYGFTGEAAYAAGEVPGSTSANRQWGVSIGYNNGPLLVKAAYQRADNATATDFLRDALIGGKWDFGIAALSLAYQDDSGLGLDTREYMVGVTVPIGPGNVLASYIHRDDRSTLDQNANQYAIGYTHAVSKRTNFYLAYGQISNDNGANFTVGNATDTGSGNRAFNIGVRHIF